MGYVYKRGSLYWVKYYRAGQFFRESTGTKKEAEAKRFLRAREGAIAEGKIPSLKLEKIRFEELADDMLTDYRTNGKKSIDRAKLSINADSGDSEHSFRRIPNTLSV
jgi:hypothetical protein